MRFLAVIVSVLLLGSVASAQKPPRRPDRGKPELHPLMRKVLDSRGKVKLAGVRVVQHIEKGERKLVTEKILRDGFRYRSTILDGGEAKGSEAVEDENVRLVWNPKTNVIRESPPREREFFARFPRPGKGRGGGKPTESEGGKVAGVSTRLLEFSGPGGQVGSRLWIEPTHGVVLKMQFFDPKGALNGSMEYTSVQFNPDIPRGSFELNKPGARRITLADELRTAARELGMKAYRIPADGAWRLAAVRKMTPKGVKVLMQMYGKEGARVSLFQIEGDVDPERLKALERGTNSYVWTLDGAKLVLIGNLSEDELRRLAAKVGA